MDVYSDSIRDLPIAEKMLLVERIWDDLVSAGEPVPLPEWALTEAVHGATRCGRIPNLGSLTTRSGSGLTIGEMARAVRYHPDLDADVIAAADWYAERQFELGLDFTFKVQDAVTRLLADPERRSSVDYGLRYWPLERFPHVVFYDLTDAEVILLGVMHTSQQPDKWIARSQ